MRRRRLPQAQGGGGAATRRGGGVRGAGDGGGSITAHQRAALRAAAVRSHRLALYPALRDPAPEEASGGSAGTDNLLTYRSSAILSTAPQALRDALGAPQRARGESPPGSSAGSGAGDDASLGLSGSSPGGSRAGDDERDGGNLQQRVTEGLRGAARSALKQLAGAALKSEAVQGLRAEVEQGAQAAAGDLVQRARRGAAAAGALLSEVRALAGRLLLDMSRDMIITCPLPMT